MKIRRVIISFAVAILLTAFWFLGVDRSWFVEGCKDCNFNRDVVQYRILCIPIHEKVSEYHPVYARVASDLGAPCPHQRHFRWHKHRWWGLCYCAWPCINGTFYLSTDDSWYNSKLIAKVKERAVIDPNLGEEFRQRVIYDHDWEYWNRFRTSFLSGDSTVAEN